ncbi:MAG: potassium channel family protein [Thermodesulfobacteriota bacterium]
MNGFIKLLHKLQGYTLSGWNRQQNEARVTEENKEEVRKERKRWSDGYNLVALVIAAAIWFVHTTACVPSSALKGALNCFVILVLYRLGEIAVNQLCVLFQTDQEYAKIPVESGDPRRLLWVALLNYLEIILWYAFLYGHFSSHFKTTCMSLDSVAGTIYFSLVTMTTLGYGDITPKDNCSAVIVSSHLLMGILLTLLVLARFVGMVSQVNKTKSGNNSETPTRNPGSDGGSRTN